MLTIFFTFSEPFLEEAKEDEVYEEEGIEAYEKESGSEMYSTLDKQELMMAEVEEQDVGMTTNLDADEGDFILTDGVSGRPALLTAL